MRDAMLEPGIVELLAASGYELVGYSECISCLLMQGLRPQLIDVWHLLSCYMHQLVPVLAPNRTP